MTRKLRSLGLQGLTADLDVHVLRGVGVYDSGDTALALGLRPGLQDPSRDDAYSPRDVVLRRRAPFIWEDDAN
jgi:hypothetical protein